MDSKKTKKINIKDNNTKNYFNKNILNETVTNSLTNKKSKIIITLIILSIILITTGSYLSYTSNPKKIFKTAINNLTINLKNITTTNEKTNIGQNITLKSTANFNVESDYINSLEDKDSPAVSYRKLIKNMNDSNTKLIYSQDINNKKMLINWIINLNNQELINTKYLIENSTEYYYVKGLLDTYVNNGSNNYFESLNGNNTTAKNIEYLYQFITKSLIKNLNNNYFESNKEKTIVNDKEKILTKVSIKLTNEKLKEITSNILNDLKNDAKANKILTSINKDFFKTKITDSTTFLKEKESITLNIYTTNLLSNIKKYEFIYSINNDEYKLTYEKHQTSSTAYLIKNDKTLYKLTIANTNSNYKIIITDIIDNSDVGQITIDNTDKRSSIMFDFQDEQTKININYDKKISNIKLNNHYNSIINLSMNITKNQINILTGNINIANEFTNKVEISEDVCNSILASSVTQEQKQLLNQYQIQIHNNYYSVIKESSTNE